MDNQYEVIEKEKISSLTFPKIEVLKNPHDIIQRESDLKRALSLGNLEHSKIKIYFEDNESKKVVDTTVWGITEVGVLLKKGVIIPINRIYKLH